MANEYKVLSIDERIGVEDGVTYKYYTHRIKTKGGIIVSVDIREKDFTPEKATPILTAKAIDADKILHS